MRGLFAGYVEAKQRQSVLDYDDLLLYFAKALAEPEIAAEIASRFDHLLVDEYQDTNRLQAEIALRLRPRGRGLTVVGDDAQSIYSFRAATVRNILDFPKSFDPPARVVTLDRNYRSTQPILAASNAVIGLSPERWAKDLWTDRGAGAIPQLVTTGEEADQARYVATRVLENREAGATLKSQAVLFRAAHHSAALELELTRRNVPFVKFGGLKFLDAAHIKDVLAALRFAENPRDRVAGFRVAQLLPGIGPASAERIVAAAAIGDGFATLQTFAPPAKARADFADFVATARTGRAGGLAGRSRRSRRVAARTSRRRFRQLRHAGSRSRRTRADRDDLSLARTFPQRADARSARRDERRGGSAASRRGLSDPVDDPFGQGPGMEVGVRAELRRRLHPFRSRDGIERRDRGGAPPALCRDDAGARRADAGRSATLLCAWPAPQRRSARAREPHAVHSA